MSQDPNYQPYSRTAPEADRPAPGSQAADEPGATFPRDEALGGLEREGTFEGGRAPAGGAATHEVDPGLEDETAGGASERPAWGRDQAAEGPSGRPDWGQDVPGGTASDLSREGGAEGRVAERSGPAGMAPTGGGAPQEVDPGLADQPPGGPAGEQPWGQGTAAGAATTSTRGETDTGVQTGGQGAAGAQAMPAAMDRGAAGEPLLDRFRERWPSVQGAFVDDPRNAVAEADRLVAEVIQDIGQRLGRRRQQIQDQGSGAAQDTEQLRQAMHGYRALFQRLLESGF